MSTGTRTEVVSVNDSVYGKIVARTEATLPDVGTVKIVGIEFPDGNVHFCEEAQINWPTYSASVEVDHDSLDTVEDSAEALIDWIRQETGPIYVFVRINGDKAPTHKVTVTFDENGRAVGTLDNG